MVCHGTAVKPISIRTRVRTLAAGLLLWGALWIGAPMRPEEIEEFLVSARQPKVAHTLRQQSECDEP